jgi:hypothetical protein
MRSPISSTVLFPAGDGIHYALTLESLESPGREYIAMFGGNKKVLEGIAAEVASNGHSKVRVVPITINRDGVVAFSKDTGVNP